MARQILLFVVLVLVVKTFTNALLSSRYMHQHRGAMLQELYGEPTQEESNDGDDEHCSQPQIYWLSLQASSHNDPAKFSRIVKRIWGWKDVTLGDGRDFFVPRPKTLQRLADYLLLFDASSVVPRTTESSSSHKDECVIISNCARFEILLWTCHPDPIGKMSRGLVAQLDASNKQKGTTLLAKLPQFVALDWPDAIQMITQEVQIIDQFEEETKELSKYWKRSNNATEIALHFCRVAAGLASRPRREDRPVPFRPFSSRDAHIMLQLKRTVDIFETRSPRLVKLLQAALRAGKKARSPQEVPELRLLEPYGTGDTKYCREVPNNVQEEVIQAVASKAIHPSVQDYTATVMADEQSKLISDFRSRCLSLASTTAERKWIQQQLHKPTTELRAKQNVNTTSFYEELKARKMTSI